MRRLTDLCGDYIRMKRGPIGLKLGIGKLRFDISFRATLTKASAVEGPLVMSYIAGLC